MSGAASPSRHHASPEVALATIRNFNGPLLIDLDHTLYLGNSTEDFIHCARPGLLALLLLKFLELIAPWRWTGGIASRDGWRVRTICWLLPWTKANWRRRVATLAKNLTNEPLAQVLHAHDQSHRGPLFIVTLGFGPIVRPLIAAMGVSPLQTVAAGLHQPRDRLQGKLALARRHLGDDLIAGALTLGDSSDDLPLLDASARALHTVWPQACFQSAFRDVYRPGRYMHEVKRPGENYLQQGILREDFAFWLLSSIGLAVFPPLHVLGLLALLLSFWTIYECGYVDNDRIAARYEQQPKLSTGYHQAAVATPALQPWLWALASGAVAIELLRWPGLPAATDFVCWLAVLATTYGWFYLYNRFDKATRVWLYAGLQLARTAAFAVLLPIAPVAALALAAHVLAKWLPYYVYRLSDGEWPETRMPLTRLLFFTLFTALLALATGFEFLLNGTAAALFGWIVFRARGDLIAIVRHAKRLDRPAAVAASTISPER